MDPTSVVHVGTFPPTQCGLATFGAALVDAMTAHAPNTTVDVLDVLDVVEVLDVVDVLDPGSDDTPRPGRHGSVLPWRQGDTSSLCAALDFVSHHDVAVVEHEFGMYGGAEGEDVLRLVERTATPVVSVLHTVLARPTPRQREIVERLARASDALVVMTRAAHDRLLSVFAVDPRIVHIIPHGAHPNTGEVDPPHAERPTILTWGLLGPGKGVEAGIDAMAHVRDLIPTPRYVVAGSTHPKVLERSGESYRRSLIERAEAAGVADLVEFDDSYRDVDSLTRLIRSADVVLLPYETTEQVTSGVLVEAVASGRPVVSTDFPHARELLVDGAGLVVPHGDPAAMASALESVLTHPRLADEMHRRALELAAPMAWTAVGERYLEVIRSVVDLRTPWRHPMRVA